MANPELILNENFDTLSAAAVYGKRQEATTGLTFAYYGGRWGGTSVSDGSVTLTDNATNYLVVARGTGVASVSATATNWDDTANYARVYKITTVSALVTATEDHRAGLNGVYGPALPARRFESKSADYTFVLADAGVTYLHPSADTTGRTWTIPANASVAFPVGTVLELVNQASAGSISIAITTDTMRLASAGTTGTRTLAANGFAQIRKLTATEWLAMGYGLT